MRYSPEKGAGFSGLQSCGSVWACPVCSAKIMVRRSMELAVGLLGWESAGGQLVMGTRTMRHHKGTTIAAEFDALNTAWGAVIGTRVWRKWLDRLGSPGLVRVVEVTFGEHGWHVHLHFVLLVDGSASADAVAAFSSWLDGKWIRALAGAGMVGALPVGQETHLVDSVTAAADLGSYLAKSTAYGAAESLGRELYGSWSKIARGAHSTVPVWRLAEEFGETGDMAMLDLWREYEQGSKGRRQTNWSRGLRKRLGLDVEATDEEVAAEVAGDEDLVQLDADGWSAVLAAPWPAIDILEAVREGGPAGLRAFLDQHGIPYTEVSR